LNVKKIATVFLVLLFFSSASWAGTTGKLAGVVKDTQTGEALPGVAVQIVGTTIGAATNIDGEYFIINVPPGRYRIKASLVGYTPVEVKDVKVSLDLTTNIDFNLTTQTIDMGTVTVEAERPIVEVDVTTTRTYFESKDFVRAPVSNIQGAVGLTAGSVQGSFRGGRRTEGETIYLVDGVSLANPLGDSYSGFVPGQGISDALATSVPRESVQEAEVLTGGFTAEYPSVQSAIINIVTKEGGSKYHGKFKASGSPEILFGGASIYKDEGMLHDYIYGYEIREYEDSLGQPVRDSVVVPMDNDGRTRYYDTRRYEFSLGGPIPIDKMDIPGKASFYLSGDVQKFGSQNLSHENPPYEHEPGYLYNFDDLWSVQGKLTWDPSANKKLVFTFLKSEENPSEWDHDWTKRVTSTVFAVDTVVSGADTSYTRRYVEGDRYLTWNASTSSYDTVYVPWIHNASGTDSVRAVNRSMLENQPLREMWSHEVSLSYAHNISAKTFYTLQGSRFLTAQKVRALDPYDGHPLTYDEMGQDRFDPSVKQYDNYWYVNPNYVTRVRQDDEQIVYTLKGDVTSQIDVRNLVKAGFELKSYDLLIDYVSRASGGNNYKSQFDVKPIGFGCYAQDKIETKGMVISFGARFDYFDPRTWVPYDPTDALKQEYNDKETGAVFDPKERFKNPVRADKKYQVSPRVGVSFPITEKDVLRFSYGHYFQMPILDHLYNNHAYDLSGAHKYIGNPDLNEQKTVAYEVGVDHGFSDYLRLSVTGFYKDISGLVNYHWVKNPEVGTFFNRFTNTDYARVKGFEVSLSQRPWRGLSGQVAYTYQIATGKSSTENSGFLDHYYGRKPRTEDWNLDWDQRHTVNATISYEIPDSWGPEMWGTHLFGDWYTSVVFSFGSGIPYSSGTNPPTPELPPINDKRYPSSYSIDTRLEKGFSLFGNLRTAFFVEVYNLTDTKSLKDIKDITRYEDSKGLDDFADANGTAEQQEAWSRYVRDHGGEINANGQFDDPSAWTDPRRFILGMQVEF
jgi:outer membrane receptor protein involved in Fe transport